MRVVVIAAVFASLASADALYLDDSWPASTRPSLQALANQVWDVVGEMFHSSLPVDLPIRVRQSYGAVPVTRVLDNEIDVRITAHGTYYAQFAFQLGHELGHVMLDPRRTNGVVEAICIALSYEVLDRIGDKVRDSPAYPWLGDYAANFRPYQRNDQQSMIAGFPAEIRDLVKQKRWPELADYLRAHRREMEAGHDDDRSVQTLAAIALRSERLDWGELAGIAGCTSPSSSDDPRFQVLPLTPDCVSRVSGILCRIGVGCAP